MTVPAVVQATIVPAIERAGFTPIPSTDKRSATDADHKWSFSNGQVRLDVYHALQTGELSLTLEHPPSDPVGVPLHQVLVREGDADIAWTAHRLILYKADRAEAALKRLATAIDRNAIALSRLTATEVNTLYAAWAEAGRAERQRQTASRKAAAAEVLWQEGNYRDCAQLLAEIEGQLSPAQLKRLELARQRV